MRRSFYLYTHRNGMIYAEIMDQNTGARLASRSTGTRNRDEAVLRVGEWLREGLPSAVKGRKRRSIAVLSTEAEVMALINKAAGLDAEAARRIADTLRNRELLDFAVVKSGPGNLDFIKFLTEFWNYDTSLYIKEKLAHGQSMTRRHAYEMGNRIRLYWEEVFKGRRMRDITRQRPGWTP
jgi:hypothetical protein